VASRVHILPVDVCYQISGNAIHACPRRDAWATSFLRLIHARAKTVSLTFPNWAQPTTGDNPDRNH
jgi:hypothetical protein